MSPEDALLEARLAWEKATRTEWPLSHLDPDVAVALARECNRLAKWTEDYGPKVLAFAGAAGLPSVVSGWGYDDCYYVEGPLGLAASAHDPYGQLHGALLQIAPDRADAEWDRPWSERHLQPHAWQIAQGLPLRRERAARSACAS